MAVFLRIFIGIVLLVSGFEKVLSPYQNFLYVLQSYELFPSWLEKVVAMSVPWVELLTGLFMVLGLWLNWSVKSALLLFLCFIVRFIRGDGARVDDEFNLCECNCYF